MRCDEKMATDSPTTAAPTTAAPTTAAPTTAAPTTATPTGTPTFRPTHGETNNVVAITVPVVLVGVIFVLAFLWWLKHRARR